MTPLPETVADIDLDSPEDDLLSRFWAGPLGTSLMERLPFGHKLPQLVRYALVSVVATVISTTILSVLTFTRTMTPGWANIVAVSVGTVPSFELNRRWVWDHDERRLLAHAAPFTALSFLGLAISTVTVHFTGLWADHHQLSNLSRTVAVDGANYIGFAILWIAQFVILDRLLFGKTKDGDSPHPGDDSGSTSDLPTAGADPTSPPSEPNAVLAAGSTSDAVSSAPGTDAEPANRHAAPDIAAATRWAGPAVPSVVNGRVLDNA